MNPGPTSECTVTSRLADIFATSFGSLDELIAALDKPAVLAALADTDASLPVSWAFGGKSAAYGDGTVEVLAWDETRIVSLVLDAGRAVLRVEEREDYEEVDDHDVVPTY